MIRPLFALALALAFGCSSSNPAPPDMGGDDGNQIAALVDQLSDEGGRAKQLKGMFATGVPAGAKEAKAYQPYRFDLKGKPSVSGTTATATVSIEKHSGGTAVEKPWEFVKEGDKWKIKAAPLP